MNPHHRYNHPYAQHPSNIEGSMRQMMADMERRMQSMVSNTGYSSEFSPIHSPHQYQSHFPVANSGFGTHFSQFSHRNHPGTIESNVHRNVVVSSSRMGPDGVQHSENYYTNEVFGKTADGHSISQKEEMYKDNRGTKKISQEKEIDGLVHKVTKVQRRGGRLNIFRRTRN